MSRAIIMANKIFEADPLTAVLATSRAVPKSVTWERKTGTAGLRGTATTPTTTFEVWCLEELMPADVNKSSTAAKAAVLTPLLAAADIGLVIAFGTAATVGSDARNGSVVIGTQVFVHDARIADGQPKWTPPAANVLVPSTLTAAVFGTFFAATTFRPLTEQRMLAAPVNPAPLRTVFTDYTYVAVADVNVTNYANYVWADPQAVDAYHASGALAPIGSVETTHAVIRECSTAPFFFVSGIANRVGFFGEENAPRDYAQNFVAAHNAGVALGQALPAITIPVPPTPPAAPVASAS